MTATKPRVIPFIGMEVDYKLAVAIESNVSFPIKTTANWNVTWEQYNLSSPEIFIANLTVQSPFLLTYTELEYETGTIIENINTREVLFVNVTKTIFLKQVYAIYYNPNQTNFTPFYINTTGLQINDRANIYNFTMSVVSAEEILLVGIGFKDIIIVEYKTKLAHIEHFVRLTYDNRTGVLIGGRLRTHRTQNKTSTSYDIEFFLQNTNALAKQPVIIKSNEILIFIICCIPVVTSLVKIFRMKEIKGGL
ncbi:MAG: hypothetical protein ACFFBD_20460 [Candidatus Hodarchaeota archaeon]